MDAPVVLVGELCSQTIDIPAAPLERQIPEHVIKRAVLHHQHDDVVNLLQVRDPNLLGHDTLLFKVPPHSPLGLL
jgi:hypothetical protein